MKKIYMAPDIHIVRIQTNSIIAASFNNGTLNLSGAAEYDEGTDEMASRGGGSFWDEE